MKLGFKSIVLALSVALLCVPAGMAKNGNGHGKPSWAGGSEKSHGKPAWAGVGKGKDKAHAKHEKVKPEKAKHQKGGAEAAPAADEEVNLDDLNPAWYCFTIESMMDADDADTVAGGAEPGEFSSFDAEFGTNDNKRNSHGQCVSRRAHGEDVADALDESQESCDPAAGEEGTDEGSTSEEPPVDDGTVDDGTVDDGTADDPAADEDTEDDSGDQADECQSDDSAGGDSQEDPADEEDATGDEADQGDATDAAAFARALVRFVRL